MRIVIDARLRGPVITGVGRYLTGIVPALAALAPGDEFILLANAAAVDLWKNLPENVSVHTVDFPPAGFKQHAAYAGVLNRLNADALLYPMFDLPLSVNVPCAIIIQDMNAFSFDDYFTTGKIWKKAASKILHRMAIMRANRVLTPSVATADEVARIFPKARNKTKSIHYGYTRIASSASENIGRFGIDGDYILFVGVHRPHKNLENLVEAFAEIKKDRPKIKLVCAGAIDDRFRGPIELVERLQLKDSVIFTGFVSDEELAALYKNAKVFAFPSFQEGFGYPLLEAMDYGVAIACSDIPIHREVAGDAGNYFDPHSPKNIGEVLRKLLENESDRKSSIDKGSAQLKKFSWEKCAMETIDVLHQIGRDGSR